ncbi:MAG TPA: SUF system Fe-S cluster assembly regulator [Alphaproteobacteria bacterium]|nr:SUF system Fe-S cluster assembly regulator [Alphaproteobacteria bacterium]
MLRLNRITDYAVVVLSQMARDPARQVTASQLAEDTQVPQPTVAKVLKTLARGKILVSHRGATGGYALAGPPEAISMLEIIRALEGPVSLTDCVDGAEGDCSVENLCPMRGNWDRVNDAIRGALESVSLADMAMPAVMFGVPLASAPAPAPVRS